MDIIWSAATLYLVLFYLIFHSRLLFYRGKKRKPLREPVSVIICARDEAANLEKNLPAILEQDYRRFEVIVVNDGSTDNTAEILRQFNKKYRKLKVVNREKPENEAGKKQAVLTGIFKARNRFLLFTDADCEPASINWLKGMAAHFRTHEVVLGFAPYRSKPHWVSGLVQWETLLTAQNYFSLALAGLPYMGVGRNLAYSKGLFINSDQFKRHERLASGDDDLFIGRKARAFNTRIELAADTFMWSDPPANFAAWWSQKRRHLSTAPHYRWLPALLLALFGLSQILFYLLGFYLLFTDTEPWSILLLGGLKFAFQLAVLWPAARRLRQQQLLALFPLWEMLTAVFKAAIHLQNLIAPRHRQWK